MVTITEEDKKAFAERVRSKLVDPSKIEKIVLSDSSGITLHTVENTNKTQSSLQIYAGITDNNGEINPASQQEGLNIFGDKYRALSRESPGEHRNIEFLEEIAPKAKPLRSVIVTKPEAKPLPIEEADLAKIAEGFGTPVIVYDETGIRQAARKINSAFSWVPGGYQNFYAVKACPNPFILEILKSEGMGADASSDTELLLSERVKLPGIMFTSNDTAASEFRMARDLGAIVNFDDITHIPFFQRNVGYLPKLAFVRFNPGSERAGNSIIGDPPEAKYGMTREQIFQAVELLKQDGVEELGLHTMICSNERNPQYFKDTAKMMFELVLQVQERTGKKVSRLNFGGGFGTPYRPEARELDLDAVSAGMQEEFELAVRRGIDPNIRLYTENGRYVTGPSGILLTSVRHVTSKHKEFAGLDATMANLMRPGMYGAYHFISVLGKTNDYSRMYDLTGSLCENNDKFAVNRMLPELVSSDLLAIHNSGAHGYAMGFNYNGKLRCPEILRREDGTFQLIRRGERHSDLFATFDFPGSKFADLARINSLN